MRHARGKDDSDVVVELEGLKLQVKGIKSSITEE